MLLDNVKDATYWLSNHIIFVTIWTLSPVLSPVVTPRRDNSDTYLESLIFVAVHMQTWIVQNVRKTQGYIYIYLI